MVNIAFILSGETTERIPNLFTELVIITHSYKAHNKLLILKEKIIRKHERLVKEGGVKEIMIARQNRREGEIK